MKILFVGDVVGNPGLSAVETIVPRLRAEHFLDLVVANGENSAKNGIGLSEASAKRLLAAGCDVLTLGNHALRQKDVFPMLDAGDRIVRPENISSRAPGRGLIFFTAGSGDEVAVINVLGTIYVQAATSPFEMIDALVDQASARTPFIFVDMHAETTSEKVALAHYLTGRVSVVVGTHTHVQTSDARILGGHTAYVTDLGMTGPHDSVIGVKTEIILRRFLTAVGQRFETADTGVQLEGVIVDVDSSGRARSIEAVRVPID